MNGITMRAILPLLLVLALPDAAQAYTVTLLMPAARGEEPSTGAHAGTHRVERGAAASVDCRNTAAVGVTPAAASEENTRQIRADSRKSGAERGRVDEMSVQI